MRLPWRKKARLIEPRPMVCLNFQELQTAKEILAEVFHARPLDVEEMIQKMAFRFLKLLWLLALSLGPAIASNQHRPQNSQKRTR